MRHLEASSASRQREPTASSLKPGSLVNHFTKPSPGVGKESSEAPKISARRLRKKQAVEESEQPAFPGRRFALRLPGFDSHDRTSLGRRNTSNTQEFHERALV